MNHPEDIWTMMANECRKAEHPVLPVFQNEPWLCASYVCQHWLHLESVDKFVSDCKTAGVPLIRIGRRPCVRMADVLEMYRANEGQKHER